jgi:hypothetical protein
MKKFICRLPSLAIVSIYVLFAVESGLAAVVSATGGPLIRVDTRSNDHFAVTNSTSYSNLPSAQVKITIPPAGGSRLIVAHFSAMSSCEGNNQSLAHCKVRIIALNTGTNITTEMHPQSGTDFKFDSVSFPRPDTDSFEAHSIKRSLRLQPGAYAIRVQFAVVGQPGEPAPTSILEAWHFTVEQYD